MAAIIIVTLWIIGILSLGPTTSRAAEKRGRGIDADNTHWHLDSNGTTKAEYESVR